MAFEIERKFLVEDDAWRGLAEPVRIRQGYVTIKAGPLTVVVYKTQAWYQKMPGEMPSMP